jgi:hypothetical protein
MAMGGFLPVSGNNPSLRRLVLAFRAVAVLHALNLNLTFR